MCAVLGNEGEGSRLTRTLNPKPGMPVAPWSFEESFWMLNGISMIKDKAVSQKTLTNVNPRLHSLNLALIFPPPFILNPP